MKNLIYIAILILYIGCKSTKTTTNNQLDLSKETVETSENIVKVNEITLDEIEITFHTADPKQPVIITDKNGNQKKLHNVKSGTLTAKSEKKKDSTVKENKTIQNKEIDKSKINETAESISDANNIKSIFKNIALIVVCLLIVFLIIRFRIKAKRDNSIQI